MGASVGIAVLGVSAIFVASLDSGSTDSSSPSSTPEPDGRRRRRSDFIDDRPTSSLIRSLVVYQLCQYEAVVDFAPRLLQLARSLGLQTVSNALVRWTFFRQFCGGESARGVAPTMRYLRGYGIGSILDLSVEADVGGHADTDGHADRVLEQVERCIDTASILPGNFAAVKVTGFGDIQALENISAVLSFSQDAFRWLSGKNKRASDQLPRLKADGFERLIQMLPGGAAMSPAEIALLFAQVDRDNDGLVDWIDFSERVTPLLADTRPLFIGQLMPPPAQVQLDVVETLNESSLLTGRELEAELPTPAEVDTIFTQVPDTHYLPAQSDHLWSVSEKFLPAVSAADMSQLDAILNRLNRVCDLASEKRVRLMVDAEQTYFQPVIDLLTLDLMRRYNQPERPLGPLVYGTYQMYLRDGRDKLQTDLERAIRSQASAASGGGFLFAAKLVRGAYLHSERLRASILGIRDPINPTPEATHAMYNSVIELVLKHASLSPVHLSEASKSPPTVGVVIATHNSRSIEVAVEGLRRYGIHPRSGVVSFAQLLGMYDFLTYQLAEDGYLVGKYIPYGPVQDVIPYLLRRAQENKAVLRGSMDGVLDDRTLIWRELRRRCRVWLGLEQTE